MSHSDGSPQATGETGNDPVRFSAVDDALQVPDLAGEEGWADIEEAWEKQGLHSFVSSRHQNAKNFKRKYEIYAAIAFTCWILVGTMFYHFYGLKGVKEGVVPTVGMAFYYAVQSGYSVGFGLLAEVSEWAQLYTICHVLFGAGVIAGALSMFTAHIVLESEEMRTKILNGCVMNDKNADGKVQIHEDWRGYLNLQYNRFRGLILFALWVVLGTIFACFKWKQPVITGLYFAITSLSTAGLFAPVSTDAISMWYAISGQ